MGVMDLTCSSAQTFRDKYDARLPLMKINWVLAHKNIRHSRKKKKGKPNKEDDSDSDEEDDDSKQSEGLKVRVPFFCPDEFIIRTMADPIWSKTLRFGLEQLPSSEPINQFNQTPYAAELLRWSQLQSIERIDNMGISNPITVGFWYSIQYPINGQLRTCCGLVKRLFYEGGKINRNDNASLDWWPILYTEVRICVFESSRETLHNTWHLMFTPEVVSITADSLNDREPIFRGSLNEFQTLSSNEQK